MNSLIIFCAQYLIAAIGLMSLILWLKVDNKIKIKLTVTTISALVMAYILSKIASNIFYNPRPFVEANVVPLFAHGTDNGFPSDHSWLSMTVAASIFYYHKSWGKLAIALAIIVGISRVLAHVHSPIDIIAGFAIGAVGAAIGQMITNRLLRGSSASSSHEA